MSKLDDLDQQPRSIVVIQLGDPLKHFANDKPPWRMAALILILGAILFGIWLVKK